MTDTPGMIELLRSMPIFSKVPGPSLERVVEIAKDITHPAGHVIVRQGGGAHAIHVIVSGQAEVSADGTVIASLGPGDHFGEIAVMEGSRRTASVTAATELRVLAIDATSFRRLAQSDAGLASSLPTVIADRLRELDERRD
jgi:CRP/FNR family cyclic AMP-dependent transcriptional regulator